LYPNDTDGRECAPTLGENRYETVRIRADQPDTFGNLRPSGIWVVAEWEMLQPPVAPVTGIEIYRHQIQQIEPISEGKATELLRAFLQARVDGEGAERYVNGGIGPLMYATTAGDPYERFEFELVRGPVWPSGWMEFKVRLFAVGGRTEVEQLFVDRKEDGRLVVLVISSSDDEIAYGEI
jgi:hypothetical protein